SDWVSIRAYRSRRSRTSGASSAASGVTNSALGEVAKAGVELLDRVDAAREELDEHALVRRVDVALGEGEAGQDRRDPLVHQRGHDRQRPAGAGEDRPDAERGAQAALGDF